MQRLLLGVRYPRAHLPGQRGREPSFSYTRVDGTAVEYASREGFDLRITGQRSRALRRADRLLGAAQAGGARRAARRDDAATRPSGPRSLARELDGQEEVYNLTEPLHHSYIVDGVVVANCSEYMHVDDSACNLASLNLMKFRRPDGSFDVEAFEHAVDIVLLAQEIIVGAVELPDRGDRRQRAGVPPARPRLRQPRRLPDGRRHALRLRRRPRRRRRRSRR